MSIRAKKRWDWINGFLTACLHSLFEELSIQIHSKLNFSEFHDKYVRYFQTNYNLLKQKSNVNYFYSLNIPQHSLSYIFHLEEEIWGANWQNYLNFFPSSRTNYEPLQTFAFVHSFFLLERCLELFINSEKKDYGRKKFRRKLFGREHGIFSKRYPELLEILGPPFYLSSNTQTLLPLGNEYKKWSSIKQCAIPHDLENFYYKTTRKTHFTQILKSSFINTRKRHLKEQFQTLHKKSHKSPRLPRSLRAYWYDVFWNYSESFRYHSLIPSEYSINNPFFWNRSVRWFTSVSITGLLMILAPFHPIISQTWNKSFNNSNILKGVFNKRNNDESNRFDI